MIDPSGKRRKAASGREKSRPQAILHEVRAGRDSPLGMSAEAFLADYWQQRPLLVRGAFPAIDAVLEPDDLAGLSVEPTARARLVQHRREDDSYAVEDGPFDEHRFALLGDRDWTLLVQDVDKWDPDVAILLQSFRFMPDWRVDDVMVSYAVPGGSVGPHADRYDVFLIQSQGRRRWRLDLARRSAPSERPDEELRLLAHFEADVDVTLEPGDMLYLPPELPHHGEALDACLTFSVGFRAPSRADLITAFADFQTAGLSDLDRFTDPCRGVAADPYEMTDDDLARAQALVPAAVALDRANFGHFFAALMTESAEGYPDVALSASDRLDSDLESAFERAFAEGLQLGRSPFARTAWHRDTGTTARIYIAGIAWECGVEAARKFAANPRIDAADFLELGGPARRAVQMLLERGVLRWETPGGEPVSTDFALPPSPLDNLVQ